MIGEPLILNGQMNENWTERKMDGSGSSYPRFLLNFSGRESITAVVLSFPFCTVALLQLSNSFNACMHARIPVKCTLVFLSPNQKERRKKRLGRRLIVFSDSNMEI